MTLSARILAASALALTVKLQGPVEPYIKGE